MPGTEDSAAPSPPAGSSAPEFGPRLLFFSGGTALRRFSRELVKHTHRSVHIITPFDSGGSSAELRRAFHMPAVGDLRNRLLALADGSMQGNPDIFRLATWRFPCAQPRDKLLRRLDALCDGSDPLMAAVASPAREAACRYLVLFRDRIPGDFDLCGASVGNLLLTGGYFRHDRSLNAVLERFSRLIGARGTVRPALDADLHLAAELADGRLLRGQHAITGKEVKPITSPLRRLWLTSDLDDPTPVSPRISDETTDLVGSADLICYPVGSFYTSVMANLLPSGMGQAVARTDCPKVYVPNPGHDSEMLGLGLFESALRLLKALRDDTGQDTATDRLMNAVLIDSTRGAYPPPHELERFRALGVEVIDTQVITDESRPMLDNQLLVRRLLSLI